MNKSVMKHTCELLNRYYENRFEESLTVLDVGSYDVNGCVKELMPPAWKYIGLDIVPGPNVDVVSTPSEPLPVPDDSIDLVVSFSCFQYVKNPFKLMAQLYKCTKPGGMIFISASHNEATGLLSLPEHLCPYNDKEFDCWRVKKYGMLAMFEEVGFGAVRTYYVGSNCWGVGIK